MAKNAQTTDTILMIRPASFKRNEQTAVNNYYQKFLSDISLEKIQQRAVNEFDSLIEKLRAKGINIIVVQDTLSPETPDSIFPNNWVSFHANGTVGLYPMYAENRRWERREDILARLESEKFLIKNTIDYTAGEKENVFLEGTGSMILDRENRKAYLARSPRSNEDLFIEFCEDFEFTPIIFSAYQTVDDHRKLIYHTNVMMCIAGQYAIICLEMIEDKKERKLVKKFLEEDGKEMIMITENQVNQFAGNMLQVQGREQKYLVMSTAAYHSLGKTQIRMIEKYNPIIHSDVSTIETCGGGSVRCMMAEVFLPKAL